MTSEIYLFKNLPDNFKKFFSQPLNDEQFVYVIKDNCGNPKTITTSVLQSIQKLQKV